MSAPLEGPRGFRGRFLTDAAARERVSGSSGPLRIPPLALARPRDTEDVAALVGWAAREGVALVPRGGGTGMPGGNVGRGVVVDLSHWSTLSVVDPDTRSVEAQPGVIGASLEEAAREAGLCLPALPSSSDRCTVGGMVSNNAAGARSFGHGAVRDALMGAEVVLPDGSVSWWGDGGSDPQAFLSLHRSLVQVLGDTPAGWPAVRKNSSGYALDRFLPAGHALTLLPGSEGTLGLVTRARLRLTPLPEAVALVLLPVPDLDALPVAIRAAETSGASVCEFLGARFLDLAGIRALPETRDLVRDLPALLMVELDGPPQRVAEGVQEMEALAAGLGVSLRTAREASRRAALWGLRHAASPVIARRAASGLVSMQFIEDSVVPDGCLPHYLRGLEDILEEEETEAVVFGHAGDGNVHVNPLVDVRRRDWRARVCRILHRTADLVADLGGTLSGEHGDGRIRAPFLERIWGSDLTDAFRAVKRAADPAGVLNPGVVVPLPGQDPLDGLSEARTP